MIDNVSSHWNSRYESGNTPWDSGLASAELQKLIDELAIQPCRVLEIGCGTGTNAIFLAQQGFEVTAVDLSELAIRQATQKAAQAKVSVSWQCADVCSLEAPREPYPLVFDRGCFHCIRRDQNVDDIVQMLCRVTETGSRFILFTGNANEKREHGPPGLFEADLREELEGHFEITQLRSFHFEDPGGVQGPLGWSCVAIRR